MSIENIKIELTSRQVEVLLEYSYPFDNEEQQLKELHGKAGDFHILITDDFYGPRLIGDLVYSANSISNGSLLDEFEELCDLIDMAISRATGKFQPAFSL